LWGKLADDGSFHPALFHMLDVGHVAAALVQDGPPRLVRVLAQAFEQPEAAVHGWAPLLVALHDMGKVSAIFQGGHLRGRARQEHERLEREGFPMGDVGHWTGIAHQDVSAAFLHGHWAALEPTASPALLTVLVEAVSGHHGRFSIPDQINNAGRYLRHEAEVWSQLRQDAYAALRRHFAPTPLMLPAPGRRRVASAALTGFMVLCDWLGSDVAAFPPTPPMPVGDYLPLSRRRAVNAVRQAGFVPTRGPVLDQAFGALFPDIHEPRPLQFAVDALDPADLATPQLIVIEAPTGEGKTEAALALAQRLAANGGASDELYFALPTMATSNQMFQRLQRFIWQTKGAGSAVHLIHGQAALARDDLALRVVADGGGEGTPASAVPEWFAPKKRALLAPFGVGTVDQAELTVLNARFYVLRLLGLAGKVVIIDEVHAYDTYMHTILEQALCWLASLGSSVILLSATLPGSRHEALASAFQIGSRARAANGAADAAISPVDTDRDSRRAAARSAVAPAPVLPYPCLARYAGENADRRPVVAAQPRRSLEIEFVEVLDPRADAERLLALVQDGGAVCRLCNTVALAQAIFEELDRRAPPDVERHLIHARFPLEERLEIERRIAERFGPERLRAPDGRAIVVGTQVLEQSLDLDFDAMVSDVAPIDLLLQRAGRVQRHSYAGPARNQPRRRPAAHAEPVVRVAVAKDASGLPDFVANAIVYDRYILWRTWLSLNQRRGHAGRITLELPGDYRTLIEASYAIDPSESVHGVRLSPFEPAATALAAAFTQHLADEHRAREDARQRVVPPPTGSDRLARDICFEEDDSGRQGWGSAFTRLNGQRVTLIPVYRQLGGLSLDPEGHQPVDPRGPRDEQLRLLRRSIPVSTRGLIQPLLDQAKTGPGWFKAAPLLRYTVLLPLEVGVAMVGMYRLRLDERLGLEITRASRRTSDEDAE